MVVQHNLQAMNANRMLGITTKSAASSTEKLSSGYRINRAADDAAGLAISEKMRKQIRGLDQASANAEDGISSVQTAEGALAEVQDMLQRMNELCVQAANGTNSQTDRQYIQDELDQLVSEIDRVAETTKFNDMYLLKGDEKVETKSTYITNYSVTYTKNVVSNAAPTNSLENKVNYTGNNNIYIVDNKVLFTDPSIKMAANKIQNGEDITDYMVTSVNAENIPGAALNTSSYVAFVNVELKSKCADGKAGSVNGNLATTTEDEKMHTDLSTNGIDEIVRANRELFVYDTKNSTVTRLTAGTDMTEYLNDDNTMNDRYRLVDILDGGGSMVYSGTDTQVYTVDQDAITGNKSVIGSNIVNGQDTDTTRTQYIPTNEGYADVMTEDISATPSTFTLGKKITVIDTSQGNSVLTINAFNAQPGTATPAVTAVVDTTNGAGLASYTVSQVNTKLQNGDFIIVEDISNQSVPYGSSLRVKETIIGKNPDTNQFDLNFVWSNNEIEYDTSMQKLYDADGNEISGMALNKFFDTNGNYTGGLYTTEQARAVDEVFGTTTSDAYNKLLSTGIQPKMINEFITQSCTQVSGNFEFDLQVGADSDRANKINVSIMSLTSAGLGIDKISSNNIGIVDATGNNATDAIDIIAEALNKVSTQRSALGAVQNRLEHTIKNLDNVVENTQSAESAIRDTDMAEEMVKYSNQNVLQQAGQSMLAQANQANQGVLSLIQ